MPEQGRGRRRVAQPPNGRPVGRRRAEPPRRRGAGTLLGAATVGGLLALGGMVVTGTGGLPAPALAAQAEDAGTEATPGRAADGATPAPRPGAQPAPRAEEPEEELESTPQALAFLEALRAADVPTSRQGLPEVLVARAVCEEDAKGTSHDMMAEGIPSVLPTVTSRQAALLIDAALEHYC